MRRVLLDENVSVGLCRYLNGCFVEVVAEIGWADWTNGDLIDAAEQVGFNVMVTADQHPLSAKSLRSKAGACGAGGQSLADYPGRRGSRE